MKDNKRKKALVFIDCDPVVRHFINNKTFRHVEEDFDVVYVFPYSENSDKKYINTDINKLSVKNKLFINMPRKRMGTWWILFAVNILRLQKGTENYKVFRSLRFRKRQGYIFTLKLEILGLPIIFPIFKYLWLRYLGKCNELEDLIEKEKPDVIIHPSILFGAFINDLIYISKNKNIPFIVCMNSWDNPTSKACIAGHPDKLIVWGPQSKKEANKYMRVPLERIETFGAAQFDVYKKTPEENREELTKIFNVPGNKKIILYAGIGPSINETKYLKMLEKAIEDGVLSDCFIIYRPHPWRGRLMDGEEDFFSIKWKHVVMDPYFVDYYKRIIVNPDRLMFLVDYETTNKLLTIADAVVSPRSTLLIEAAIKGKPVLIYFPEEQEGFMFSINSVHFKDYINMEHVNVCLSTNDFSEKCADLRNQIGNESIKDIMIEHAKYFTDLDDGLYAEKLNKLVNELTT